MQNKPILIILAAFSLLFLSACGGGGSDGLSKAQEEALQAEVEAAEEARRQAELEQARAEAAAEEARRQRDAAEQQRQQEEQERQAAEEERQRLQSEADRQREIANTAKARLAYSGFSNTALSAPTVTVGYRAKAQVTATGATFTQTSTSSSGRWYVTSLSGGGDEMVIYSDVGAPTREKMFGKTAYTSAFNNDGTLSGNGVDPSGSTEFKIASSQFKKNQVSTFAVKDHDNDANTDPQTSKISGSLDGASGYFLCTGTTTCTVSNTGGSSYTFAGTWAFHPSSASVTVSVDDESYMYFGWWRKEATTGANPISYGSFKGGAFAASDVSAAGGTATYRGSAIGQYAVHQPAGVLEGAGTVSGHGSFTASAVLQANFDAAQGAGELSGTITNFSHASNWALTLKNKTIASGGVSDGELEWSIGGVAGAANDNDRWDATFYRDNSTGTAQPEGVAGTFDASYGNVGRLKGAFGAHR